MGLMSRALANTQKSDGADLTERALQIRERVAPVSASREEKKKPSACPRNLRAFGPRLPFGRFFTSFPIYLTA